MNPHLPVGRRTALGAAAWTAPVIVVATAAPALAASVTSLQRTSPASPTFSEDTAASRVVSVSLLNGSSPVPGEVVVFTMAANTWLRFAGGTTTASVTTTSAGLAATTLSTVAGVAPAPGDQVTLTATYQTLSVVWTVTYRPFDVVTAGPGAEHALAIAAGAVYSWGKGANGRLGNGGVADTTSPSAVVVAGTPMAGKTIASVSAGQFHSLALATDGSLYGWGAQNSSQLGNGYLADTSVPVAVATAGTALAGKTIVRLLAGVSHSVALDSTGVVYAWGANSRGQLGIGSPNGSVPSATAVATAGTPMAGKRIVSVSPGENHCLALDDQGVVYSWGRGTEGQLGNSANVDSRVPVAVTVAGTPMAGKTVVAVAAAGFHSVALASDSSIFCWGSNFNGELGTVGNTDSNQPVAMTTSNNPMTGKTIVGIVCGRSHTVALGNDGNAYSWGASYLGNGSGSSGGAIVVVTKTGTPMAGKTITTVTAGSSDSFATTSDRLSFAWGSAANGRLGNGTTTPDATTAVKVLVAP